MNLTINTTVELELILNANLTGLYVELFGDEGEWWKVTSDNGNRVEVTCVTSSLAIAPRDICAKRFIADVATAPKGYTITKL